MASTEAETLGLKEGGRVEGQETGSKTEQKGMERCEIRLMGTRKSGKTEEQREKKSK